MKKILLFFGVVAVAMSASAQYYKDAKNKDMLHIQQPRNLQRKEFHAPDIDGYKAYKADLHTHTVFSDGHLSMEARVREAWADGLDVMAVTEHLEYRPHEKNFVKYYQRYMPKGTEAQAYNFVSRNRPADKEAIKVDYNVPIAIACDAAKAYGLTIIPGIEITRREGEYSHFNALFTSDNNIIYAPETIQSLRNAKAHNALVMHNHPGWTHKDMKLTPFEKVVYKEGLIDGIEVMNGDEFYPQSLTRATKYGLFITSCTDIHYPSAERFNEYGAKRNMTIIYAKDKSLESLREAIEAKRTLAYSYGTLAGSEELLRKFFENAISVQHMPANSKGNPTIIVTNHSSIDWLLLRNGGDMEELGANSSILIEGDKSGDNLFKVLNTWYGEDKHLEYDLFSK